MKIICGIFFGLFLTIALSSCGHGQKSLTGVSSKNFSRSPASTSRSFITSPSIEEARVNKEQKTVEFDLKYGGGCGDHKFELKTSGCAESSPVQCTYKLTDTTNDSCESLLYSTEVFTFRELGWNDSYFSNASVKIEGHRGSEASFSLPKISDAEGRTYKPAVKAAKVNNENKTVEIDLSYGGGCGSHNFELKQLGGCRESFPVSCSYKVTDTSNDNCEGLLISTEIFTFRELGWDDSYYSQAGIRVEGGSDTRASFSLPKISSVPDVVEEDEREDEGEEDASSRGASQDDPGSESGDFFTTKPTVNSVKVDNANKTVTLDLSYGGGCGDHKFSLKADRCLESFPVQCSYQVIDTTNDGCEALLHSEETFTFEELGWNSDYFNGASITIIGMSDGKGAFRLERR